MRTHPRLTRLFASAAIGTALALSLAACKTTRDGDVTGSIRAAEQTQPTTDAEWRRVTAYWGERYRANTKDAEAAIRYAQALRATEQRAQAAAVLEQSSMENPHNKQVLGAFGRAGLGDGPGNRAVVGHAHDQAALAAHQTRSVRH